MTTLVRSNWRKISTVALVMTALSIGGYKAYAASTSECCAAGSACCHPGAPCCNHGKIAAR